MTEEKKTMDEESRHNVPSRQPCGRNYGGLTLRSLTLSGGRRSGGRGCCGPFHTLSCPSLLAALSFITRNTKAVYLPGAQTGFSTKIQEEILIFRRRALHKYTTKVIFFYKVRQRS